MVMVGRHTVALATAGAGGDDGRRWLLFCLFSFLFRRAPDEKGNGRATQVEEVFEWVLLSKTGIIGWWSYGGSRWQMVVKITITAVKVMVGYDRGRRSGLLRPAAGEPLCFPVVTQQQHHPWWWCFSVVQEDWKMDVGCEGKKFQRQQWDGDGGFGKTVVVIIVVLWWWPNLMNEREAVGGVRVEEGGFAWCSNGGELHLKYS
ncbi:unnamed protein product [Lactuca saligna]|uniref:Uncharacterized protein n=1 Tax=Lactuca saligna TaxID=75948 RepID=A0AA35Y180_LACSI|nr:unnamed protein product [Lactuca saligna]